MTRFYLIVNPISGRGNGEVLFPLIDRYLRDLHLDFEMVRTQAPGHAIQLAEQAAAAGFDVVVSVGGDGTLNEVVNGLMLARLKGVQGAVLGLIPVGRGNDFGFGINVTGDLESACQTLAHGKRRVIDVGFVQGGDYPDGRYFGNGVGIGFDAVVGFEALKQKRLRGFPSYIVAALKTIFLYFQAPTLQIQFDDQNIVQSALMVSVMNGRRMGGGFLMAPQGIPDDGLFDLCLVSQVKRLETFRLIVKFMQGSQAGHPAVRMERTDHLTVTALQGSLPAHADGETLCTAGRQLEMKILPKALEVIVPAEIAAP